jgi:hypothetical protein
VNLDIVAQNLFSFLATYVVYSVPSIALPIELPLRFSPTLHSLIFAAYSITEFIMDMLPILQNPMPTTSEISLTPHYILLKIF